MGRGGYGVKIGCGLFSGYIVSALGSERGIRKMEPMAGFGVLSVLDGCEYPDLRHPG